MKRQQRTTGRARQPHRTRLRHASRTAGSVQSKAGGMPALDLTLQRQQRPHPSPRGRPRHGAIAEVLDDARDPLPVEVLTRERDDAAIAEEPGRGQDARVPEGDDGDAARLQDLVVMVGAFDLPGDRAAKPGDCLVCNGSLAAEI